MAGVSTEHLSAVILAAGLSSRMGRFKPLLPLGDTTVVERMVALYQQAGIDDICVVIGYQGEKIRAALKGYRVRCVLNSEYEQGMFSSVQAGVGVLPSHCRGFFLHPVDIALVRPITIRAVTAVFDENPTAVVHPTFDGRRGHPPLVPGRQIETIVRWTGLEGLRGLWQDRSITAVEVPVADRMILLDMDTDDAYRQVSAFLKNNYRPAADECRVLMTRVQAVPEAVRQHCDAVATVAVQIAGALQNAGLTLDVDLIQAAALVHDIARTQPDHAAAGAKLLADLDYPRVAEIVKVHMDIEIEARQPLDEAQIVFLADKLVVGHRLVDLQERFARKMARYGNDPVAAERIEKRQAAALTIQSTVEGFVGVNMSTILSVIDEQDAS